MEPAASMIFPCLNFKTFSWAKKTAIPHTKIVDKPRYNWRGYEVQGYCVQSILIPISLMNRHVVLFKSFNVSPNDK